MSLPSALKSTVKKFFSSRTDRQWNATMLRAQRVNDKPIDARGASNVLRYSLWGLLPFMALSCPHARALESMPSRLYEVTTETGMPHLEENFRYGITREKRCLGRQEIFSAFPILSQESLKGCGLHKVGRHADTVSYLLICKGGYGTTGTAEWHLGADKIRGTLNVKLGGKNMTFYQRITAKPLGECVSEAK